MEQHTFFDYSLWNDLKKCLHDKNIGLFKALTTSHILPLWSEWQKKRNYFSYLEFSLLMKAKGMKNTKHIKYMALDMTPSPSGIFVLSFLFMSFPYRLEARKISAKAGIKLRLKKKPRNAMTALISITNSKSIFPISPFYVLSSIFFETFQLQRLRV